MVSRLVKTVATMAARAHCDALAVTTTAVACQQRATATGAVLFSVTRVTAVAQAAPGGAVGAGVSDMPSGAPTSDPASSRVTGAPPAVLFTSTSKTYNTKKEEEKRKERKRKKEREVKLGFVV